MLHLTFFVVAIDQITTEYIALVLVCSLLLYIFKKTASRNVFFICSTIIGRICNIGFSLRGMVGSSPQQSNCLTDEYLHFWIFITLLSNYLLWSLYTMYVSSAKAISTEAIEQTLSIAIFLSPISHNINIPYFSRCR